MPKLIINWPDDNFAQDKEDFLRINPNQTTNKGEENLTDNQWIYRKIVLWIKGEVIRGQKERFAEAQQEPIGSEITVNN